MKRLARRLAALLAIAIAPLPLHAQLNSTQFNIAAGASLPAGDFGNAVDVGYNVTIGLGMRQPGSPLGFRVEGTYNEWSISNFNAKTHAGGVVANTTYDFSTATNARSPGAGNTFYGIGGLGWFGTGGGGTHVGWNIGGGFRFPLSGFSAYLEARYHNISDGDIKFVPVVFGLVF